MHDIRLIRENPKEFDAKMELRKLSNISSQILTLDEIRRTKIRAAEKALADRNEASKNIGKAKANDNELEFNKLRSVVSEKKIEISLLEDEAKKQDKLLTEYLMQLPNSPMSDVPVGDSEKDNIEINQWGKKPEFEFKAMEHFELSATIKTMDFETARNLSGSRFVILNGSLARLHRALAQFMLDTHVEKHELTEMNTPVLVRDEAMIGTGQLPKFSDDSYQTTDGRWLIPTSEVTLTNTVANKIIKEEDLPIRMTAHSLCFRSEAGSAGRDTSGMLRQHQFEKVEMVSIVHPKQSIDELDRMTKCAENILESLNLPYRTVVLCTGDMGATARRTHDIEVWLPGQNKYREISSCSTCGDFQARRMNARFKPIQSKKLEFVHTLNGSGLAVGRCLIAVLENGQLIDGSVKLPDVLIPYLGGKSKLNSNGSKITRRINSILRW